ncbi:MAG: DUF6161 domain-containing protein [Gammaproteobacteria bacterium]|nr:DUF6161 domain-containing protein [Gammaproteobacteria bacterium]
MEATSHASVRIQDAAGKTFTFSDLAQFNQFVEQEEYFWRTQGKRFDVEGKMDRHGYFESHKELEEVKITIDSLRGSISELDERQREHQVHDFQQRWDRTLRKRWLWSNHLFIQAFIKCNFEHGGEAATAFINYAVRGEASLGSGPEFLGTMLAYECLNPDRNRESRRDGERKSLERLRDRLHAETEKLQQWTVATRDETQEWMESAQSGAKKTHALNKNMGERQIMNQSIEFDKQMKSWKQEIKELNGFYAEVLRWREPAKHWKKAAAEHRCEGIIWICLLILTATGGLGALGYFFYSWLQGQEIGVDLKTLNGVVLFASIMAVYAFLVRILSRLALSSFHLMRDAKEREQLTYLYLSLSETDPSEKESRDIVLRSLFSRSQTGLLTNENGPSIPAEIVRAKQE